MRSTVHTNLDYITRWLAGLLVFLLPACKNTPSYQQLVMTRSDSMAVKQQVRRAFDSIRSIAPMVHDGDLILRTGNDFTSESLRGLNQRDQTYSHCGIASIEHDSVFVYHALGGEWNPDQKIRRDPVELFAEPYSNRGIGIYRFDIPATQVKSLLDTVRSLHHAGVMFDMKFDLATDDHMYCAEFVSKCYDRGTAHLLGFPVSQLGNFRFVGVDDIFLHPLCHELKRILYK